ncbi:hypothetical protein BDB00DRAFT_583784 [Zychaea mexicana]|uniref:uncharacterized protein n=1 Tax=Zychaea mexicana TaxID=64656 RepID=UPI0022FF1959|nr:uncharacterized protein BDB00DRAFT_583784 [Zychaea mexicana]KAI9497620.1 hypothetical protein BDB00DRAFT_583784 [Zychaea mexicana]
MMPPPAPHPRYATVPMTKGSQQAHEHNNNEDTFSKPFTGSDHIQPSTTTSSATSARSSIFFQPSPPVPKSTHRSTSRGPQQKTRADPYNQHYHNRSSNSDSNEQQQKQLQLSPPLLPESQYATSTANPTAQSKRNDGFANMNNSSNDGNNKKQQQHPPTYAPLLFSSTNAMPQHGRYDGLFATTTDDCNEEDVPDSPLLAQGKRAILATATSMTTVNSTGRRSVQQSLSAPSSQQQQVRRQYDDSPSVPPYYHHEHHKHQQQPISDKDDEIDQLTRACKAKLANQEQKYDEATNQIRTLQTSLNSQQCTIKENEGRVNDLTHWIETMLSRQHQFDHNVHSLRGRYEAFNCVMGDLEKLARSCTQTKMTNAKAFKDFEQRYCNQRTYATTLNSFL